MYSSFYTIILHGNDATGKSTLVPALRACGETVYARGDEDPTLEDSLAVRSFDKLTLQLADDERGPLPESYTARDGIRHRIVRIILDSELGVLQSRLAKRPSTDKWETEKSLFYFGARFLELAAFYGLPVVDTGKKSVNETVSEIIDLARNTEVLGLFSRLALRTLTPNDVASLADRRAVMTGVDYAQRLEEMIATECGEMSIFTPEDVRTQCSRDPGLVHALVNHYDNLHDANAKLRLRLVIEGESKQVYKVETPLTRYFDDHVLILLKPTIYSHSKQATAEITGLGAIRATGSRLFLEMLQRAGIRHTYEGLNAYGLIWARSTDLTPIETVYKEICAGTDKHSFFGASVNPNVTLPTGRYKRGPYVRFDWRNPNYTYKGVNPAAHPFYHLMEASVGKEILYQEYLTARAKPMGDKCVPEELVHGVQAVEASVEGTVRVFFTIQHYLHQIGLEIQDGCIMLDPTGRTMWSEINQDCMRIKRQHGHGQDAFDKDAWRAGGSSAKETILKQWTQLNNILGACLAHRPFHENEMLSTSEPYGLHARQVLADKTLTLTPRYLALYKRLAEHDRSLPSSSPPCKEAISIGVTANKYADKTDHFTLTRLGVQLVRPEGRCLRLGYDIIDPAKFTKAFGEGMSVHFVPTRPKDMPGLIAQGTLDGAVTYSSVMDNFPTVARLAASVPDMDLELALIARDAGAIDPSTWNRDKPARIVAEHVCMVRTHLEQMGIASEKYEIQPVLGSSESYLVNDPRETYILCDAIVSTGSTLQANNLQVWRLIKPRGHVVVGLYQRL
ncbi:hypothetical protein DM02DRAFT_694274 [Periconia macrospinosa]|uniref:ATP phosphoribosyltransferase n=1 Tax=Periconia macrospinosa TaxID=97972 RepID=A0A2V1D7H5_9PLEO|nr:hypothetical protein DM02DRAFT_694274 [Periconia macrospinosa]